MRVAWVRIRADAHGNGPEPDHDVQPLHWHTHNNASQDDAVAARAVRAIRKTKVSKSPSSSSTLYAGVSTKNGKRFTAEIEIDQKRKYLGRYDTPAEAARAVDRAVVKHRPPSTWHTSLNFPELVHRYQQEVKQEQRREKGQRFSQVSARCDGSDGPKRILQEG